MSTAVAQRTGTTYEVRRQKDIAGRTRAVLTCTEGSGAVTALAWGPEEGLDLTTAAGQAVVVGATLENWLGRSPTPGEVAQLLERLAAGAGLAGQPWQLTGEQLEQAGFQP